MCTLLPFYFLVPLYEVGGAALRGIGHSLAPAVLTVLGTCVLRLIWVFTVCRIWPDYRVLMLVYPITWALTGCGYHGLLFSCRSGNSPESSSPIGRTEPCPAQAGLV